jgi:hypothetical protein
MMFSVLILGTSVAFLLPQISVNRVNLIKKFVEACLAQPPPPAEVASLFKAIQVRIFVSHGVILRIAFGIEHGEGRGI